MTEEHSYIVKAKFAIPVEKLLIGIGHVALVFLDDTATIVKIVDGQWVADSCATIFVNIYSVVCGEFEVLKEAHFCISGGIDRVAFCVIGIIKDVRHTVAAKRSTVRTAETCILTLTVVIENHAVGIGHYISLSVADIHRIDRGD